MIYHPSINLKTSDVPDPHEHKLRTVHPKKKSTKSKTWKGDLGKS